MELQPHQQRVVTEKAELDEKLGKLKAFFNTDIFAKLENEERSDLAMQAKIMDEYSGVLGRRINRFSA